HRGSNVSRPLAHRLPVGNSGVPLFLGATVDRHCRYPRVFQNGRGGHGVDRIRTPSKADLGCNRPWADGLHNGRGHSFQERTISEQSRSTMFGDHLIDRTTEIQVDKVRLHPIHDRFRRLRHAVRIRAEQLDAERPLYLSKIEHLARVFISMQNTIRGDKLGHQYVRPLLFAESPEYRIRDPRHRSEVKRTHMIEPGKHGEVVSCQLSVVSCRLAVGGWRLARQWISRPSH